MSDKTSNSIDLDLTQVDNEDTAALVAKIDSFYTSEAGIKNQLSWNWERVHQFLDSNQWIVYDGTKDSGGSWRSLEVSGANQYIPRPVTNLIFDAYQTLKSYLVKTKPSSTVFPNTQRHSDKSAAKLATLALKCTYERLGEEHNYEYAAACMVTYGTVFKKSYWDVSAVSMVEVPVMEERLNPETGEVEEMPAVDPETQEPLMQELPLGDVNTDVVEPYRMAIDPLAPDIHKARWIMEYSIQPINWIKEVYGRSEEGFTGKADSVKPETDLSSSLQRFFNLKTSSGIKTSLGQSRGSSEEMIDDAAVVKEYYERPSRKYPRGRMIVVANKVLLYAGDSPNVGTELGDWHPYSECRWEIVPGRFWGKGPLDDAIDLQKQVNSIDSVIILTRKTVAVPQKLIPIGCGIAPGTWTGRPGQEVYWRSTGANGARPETIPPSGVDSTVFQERQMRVEDIKNITGAVDILKGDRPPGVTAHRALQLLYEVGTGKLFPTLDRWRHFVEVDQKKQLKLMSKHYVEPRPAFIEMLKRKNKDLTERDLDNFVGEDLRDNCNVVIEAGSNVPKLQSAQQAWLMELAQAGVLQLEQPQNRAQFLQNMGVTGFDNDIGPDLTRAQWENDLIDLTVEDPQEAAKVLVLDVDNHEVHLEAHKARMKEPSFMDLDEEVQTAFMQHISEHQEKMAAAEQEAQMQAMAAGAPAPEQGSALAPQDLTGHGKGAPKDVEKSLYTDMEVPGQS